MSESTNIFFMRVADHADPESLSVTADTPARDVVGLMTNGKASAAVVVDAARRPIGIVTEQDIVRRAAFRADPDQPASDIMSMPVRTIGTDERLYAAIARMRRFGHQHMPVVDEGGVLCGGLGMAQALVLAAGARMASIDALTRDDTTNGLRETKASLADIARRLLDDGLEASDIQPVITDVNGDIYRRQLEISLHAMQAAGQGDPPVPFSMIIMGSGGRGENFLTPDQDYGFILDDAAAARRDDIDAWFVKLAEHLSAGLDAVGLPYCKGDVMATNPQWRKTLSEWCQQIDTWNARALAVPLLSFDIFFDFQGCWGDPALPRALRQHVTKVTKGNEPFLRALFAGNRDHGTARRWFGRFATETKKPDHKGKVNLKLYGTLPLVEGVRMLALRAGVMETATRDRLQQLNQIDVLSGDDFDALDSAYRVICDTVLRQQVADAANPDAEPSSYVDPATLTRRQRRELWDSLKAVDQLRSRLKFEVGGEVI